MNEQKLDDTCLQALSLANDTLKIVLYSYKWSLFFQGIFPQVRRNSNIFNEWVLKASKVIIAD